MGKKDEIPYTVFEYLHFLVVMTKFSKYFVSDKRGIHVIRGNRLPLTKYVIKSLKWLEPSNLLLKSRSNIKQISLFRKWRQIVVTSKYPVLFGFISHSLLMSLLILLLLVTCYVQATQLFPFCATDVMICTLKIWILSTLVRSFVLDLIATWKWYVISITFLDLVLVFEYYI